MDDAAPVSSRHVRIKLLRRADVPDRELDRIKITTRITKGDRAETSIERPLTSRRDHQETWDREIQRALHELEGAGGSLQITMGRTFIIQWDGICRPI